MSSSSMRRSRGWSLPNTISSSSEDTTVFRSSASPREFDVSPSAVARLSLAAVMAGPGRAGSAAMEQSCSLPEPVAFTPLQTRPCLTARAVFASYPTTVVELIDTLEHVVPGDLTRSRFVTTGNVGELHVRDHPQELLHSSRGIPLRDLAMIDVELQPDPVRPDRLDHCGALLLGAQEETRNIALVDRLQRQLHDRSLGLFRRPP